MMPHIQRRETLRLIACAGMTAGLASCHSATPLSAKSTSLPAVTPTALPADPLAHIQGNLAGMGGYDLQTTDLGPYPVVGWEGLPTRLYKYTKEDRDDKTKKPGLAVMLNPSKEQVGRWIVQAVIEAKGSYDKKVAADLAGVTNIASGFQFLVRGVHWEAMNQAPKCTAYVFRDGVTVTLKRFGDTYLKRPMTEGELRYTVECPETEVISTKKYARIQSTTREQYRSHGGQHDTTGHLWRAVVRDLYKAAWGQDRNELMVARAKAPI